MPTKKTSTGKRTTCTSKLDTPATQYQPKTSTSAKQRSTTLVDTTQENVPHSTNDKPSVGRQKCRREFGSDTTNSTPAPKKLRKGQTDLVEAASPESSP